MVHESQRRLTSTAFVFVFILFFGTAGFRTIEGWPWVDCVYMAVITVTTVGFGEIHPMTEGGRLFTTVLILLGVGGITYAMRNLTDYVVAGELKGFLEERRMNRLISSLSGHYIVCGFGRLGKEVCMELRRENRQLLIVDENHRSVQDAQENEFPVLEKDAALDAVLLEAGIDRAAGLVAATDDDARNILVVLSARALNPDLSIVARVSSEEATEKFIRAGADSVFLPYKTGGRRMTQVLLRPDVAGFLEVVLHDEAALGILLENFTVESGSPMDGHTLMDTGIREETGAHVVGLKRQSTGEIVNLTTSTVFKAGDTVIALGSREQLGQLAEILKAP